jgi:hypothetical protein
MAKVDTKTGKVTVQKGDTISSIAKAVTTATGKKFTTAQITAAIKKNPVLGPRLGTGKTVLFSGSSFTFDPKPNASGVTSAATVPTNNISSTSFVAPMVSSPEPPTPAPVKMPSRDVVSLVDPGIDSATIQNLLFENIGATELIKFTRHDTVDGINPYYDIISNLSDIKRRYDPSSLISLQKPESSFFDIFTIKLDQKIPDQEYLDENNLLDYVYIDESGNLVIELTNLASDEIIEVEIDSNGTIYDIGEVI